MAADLSRPVRGKALELLKYLADPLASRKIADVAVALGIHPTYASTTYQRLHRAGLISRHWYKATLTEAGRELIN